ncbi:ribbon-helix-helix protein, CopG family [Photorhabdus temperata]|nr:ribbon-helix-helix protein, CopG family [Photorhabdus temperata]MCT8346497.1 ribbon-helix-helix protein, CopG family [Photorhabdus temperata]
MEKIATSVKLNDNLKSRIQYLAEVGHRSAHWIMREAQRERLLKKSET